MRSTWRATALVLSLLLIAPGIALAQARARLIGRIIDPAGKPIQGVTVTATSPQLPKFKETRNTDRRGTFLIDFDDIDVTYHYVFDKPGFQTLEVNQEWHFEGTQRFDWTMNPGSTPTMAVSPGAAPVSTSEPAVAAFNAGVVAVRSKDYAAAETQFKAAVQADPKLARAWAELASVQVLTGHNEQAVESAEKAMELGLKDEAVLTARWEAYRNLKNDAKAAEALSDLKTVARVAEEAKKIHNEAVALTKTGDDAGAYAKFKEALNVDPTLQPALIGLATAALKLGKNEEAATAAETVLKTDPRNDQALRLRYNACLKLGDKARLFDALVGLAAVEPAVAVKGLTALAFEAYDANDLPLAKQRFLKVLEISPNEPLAHYYVGLAYVNEGNNAEARKHLEQFIALAPNSQEAATAREMLKQLPK